MIPDKEKMQELKIEVYLLKDFYVNRIQTTPHSTRPPFNNLVKVTQGDVSQA